MSDALLTFASHVRLMLRQALAGCQEAGSKWSRNPQERHSSSIQDSTLANSDIVGHLMEFVPRKHFLFFAPVSTTWQEAWGQQPPRPTVTSVASPESSVSQIQESFECDPHRDGPNLCAAIAEFGKLDLLQFARENGCSWIQETSISAARAGHVHIIKWAMLHGCPCVRDTVDAAARGGHLDVLRWLRMNDYACDDWVMKVAAYRGHLHVLRWLQENKCPLIEGTTHAAAVGGYVPVLRWLKGCNCSWDRETWHGPALRGELAMFQWLRCNGCPSSRFVSYWAACGGHVKFSGVSTQ